MSKVIVGYRTKKPYQHIPEHSSLTRRTLGYDNKWYWSNGEPVKGQPFYVIAEAKANALKDIWEPIMIEKDILTDKKF